MLYMILGQDADHALAARKAARAEHIERLQALLDRGRLVLAGPLPAIDAEDPGPAGFTGSLLVAEFESLDAALDWARDDPYIASGAWTDVDVRPFRQVLP